jgi:hypothetical protein
MRAKIVEIHTRFRKVFIRPGIPYRNTVSGRLPGLWLRNIVIASAMILMVSGTAFASQSADETLLVRDVRAELNKAVAMVAEAKRRGALWLSAQTALENAKAAFARGDLKEAVSQAQLAQRFVELGIDQLKSEPYKAF